MSHRAKGRGRGRNTNNEDGEHSIGGNRHGGRGRGQQQDQQYAIHHHGHGQKNGHTHNQQQEPQPSLTNFFKFPSNPLPVIPQPPQRWTANNSVASLMPNPVNEVNDSRWLSAKTTPFVNDDNKNYVEFFHQEMEKKLAQINLEKADDFDDEYSLMGTIPPSGVHCNRSNTRNGVTTSTHADAEVFWKFKMNERRLNTSNLVINKYETEITSILERKQVLIVEGFTGCGKTTQVPQFILDYAAHKEQKVRIAVTQPRRIAAISVANRVCDERGWALGSLVGYQVGMDRKVTDDTRVVYMTTGVLLQHLINKKNLTDYTHIIIDEVHERDLDTDLLLLVIKKIITDRRDSDTKIILMSATLDTDKFLKYFPVFQKYGKKEGTSVISVSQPSAYEVQELYLDQFATRFGYEGFDVDGSEEPRVFVECYELASRIINHLDYLEYEEECKRLKAPMSAMTEIEKNEFTTSQFYLKQKEKPPPRGAVLAFLPGFVEIDTLYKHLVDLSNLKAGNFDKPDVAKWTIFPLHSSVTAEEQQRVFKPAPIGHRKIILATNIAESSITVPDIKYVIDFCLTKSNSCDPSTNFSCLRMEWASKNQCIQRRGRCGRVAPGICYRLISQAFYINLMPQEALPEMERASLESVILNVKQLGMGCPLEVLAHAIDPPKQSGIGRAVANLKEVGALTLSVKGKYDAYDGDMTFMGSVMAKLPIDFRLGRLIVLGHVLGCVDDAIVIAASLSTKSPFSHPYSKRLDAWLSKFGWSNRTYSDCFALLNSFYNWTKNHRDNVFRTFSEEKTWARTYYLQLSVIREIGNTVEEIKKRLQNVGIFSDAFALPPIERGFILKLLIAGAFYPNYFVRPRPNKKEYERETAKEVGGYNPLSSVVFLGFPIDQPGKLYARHIADKMTYTNCIPQIHFKSSKVIVCFDPRGDKIGAISFGVYRAVKMRMLRDRLTFYTLPREDSKRFYDDCSNFINLNPVIPAPKCVSLPGIEEFQFSCVVSYISEVSQNPTQSESPHEFYVTREGDEPCLRHIEEILTITNDQRLKLLPSDNQFPGAVCIIKKKKKYYRARIEAVSTDQALVFAIDLGFIIWKSFQQLYKVPDEMIKRGLLKFPALAIRCRLSELKPSCKLSNDWVNAACEDFGEFLTQSNNNFIFKVFSVVDGIVAGELYSPKLDDTINNVFLKKTYLEPSTEPHESTENNNYRRVWRMMRYDEAMIKAIDEKQEGLWEPTRYNCPPRVSAESGTEVTLRGPSSPLEMQFTSLCRSAHMKMVQVEGSSVNCVALDTDPFNPCSRVMIAATVGIAHRSGNILARETTILPPIPGLLSLLTLVFAPQLEFRLDDDHTRYTGCVSGLGTDPIKGDPVYSDHDMEIIFDVKIDNDDLDLINSIRMTCNMLLRENSGQHNTLEALREKVRSELTRLLQRDRDPIDETWPDVTHVWNRLKDKGVQFHHNEENYNVLVNDVFSLHVGVCLNPPIDGEPTPARNVFQAPFPF